nr:putative trna pseudouridine synthase 4 [Quercus suber]
MGGSQNLYRSLMHNRVTDFANIFVNTMKSSPEPAKHILEGCFAIHKPCGITSAQVIRDVQRHFDPSRLFKPMLDAELARREAQRSRDPRQKKTRKERRPLSVKMGHGGTLDPMATGVLVLGVGTGTKSLPKFLECTKSYETVLLMGAATDTYDTSGKIVARKPYEHVTRQVIEEALGKFRGKIMQKPPLWSALRVQGKRLYEYAREGKEVPVEIKERPVEVLDLQLLEWMDGGSHEWHWPMTEAPQEEKEFAEKILDVQGTANGVLGNDGINSKMTNGRTEKATTRSIETPTDGLLPHSTSVDTNTRRPNEINTKRKREDDEIANNEIIDAALPSHKRVRSPPGATSKSSSIPTASIDISNIEEDTVQSTIKSASSETTRPPCPAPAMRIRMTVTSGFYVRSLCQDLGVAVGSMSTMASLVRSRQADFTLGTNVLPYEDLAKGEDVWGPQVKLMLEDWQRKENLAKQDGTSLGTASESVIEQSVEGSEVILDARQLTNRERKFTRRNTSSAEPED